MTTLLFCDLIDAMEDETTSTRSAKTGKPPVHSKWKTHCRYRRGKGRAPSMNGAHRRRDKRNWL